MPLREPKLFVASDTTKIEANLIYHMFEMLKMPSKTIVTQQEAFQRMLQSFRNGFV